MPKRLQSWHFSVWGQKVVLLRRQSGLDWCSGSLRGSWCHNGELAGALGERGARLVAWALSEEEEEGGNNLGHPVEGPVGEGSWDGRLAVGQGSGQDPPCVQSMTVLGTLQVPPDLF